MTVYRLGGRISDDGVVDYALFRIRQAVEHIIELGKRIAVLSRTPSESTSAVRTHVFHDALDAAASGVDGDLEVLTSQLFRRLERDISPPAVLGASYELIVRPSASSQRWRETRPLAEEWTYRYLAAAHAWASGVQAAIARIGAPVLSEPRQKGATGQEPAEIRRWARAQGLDVSDRGKIPAALRQAWEQSSASRPYRGRTSRTLAEVRQSRLSGTSNHEHDVPKSRLIADAVL